MIACISDLHIGYSKNSIQLLEKFCKEVMPNITKLYILGDLFDMWLGNPQIKISPDSKYACDLLSSSCKKNSVSLYIMRGNRDILLTPAFSKICPCNFLPDEYIATEFGKHYLFMHGDTLCSLDKKHLAMRKQIDFICKTLKLNSLLPFKLLQFIANKIQAKSKQKSKQKQAYIMDVVQTAVDKTMQKHHILNLIHGHTHQPKQHKWLDNKNQKNNRWVLGCWDNPSAIYCTIDKDGVQLKTISLNA